MPVPGGTTARGYGSQHQKLRLAALAALVPGSPCPRCGHPMHRDQALDLDHTDDRVGYQGLAHRACNRRAGADKTNRKRRKRATQTVIGRW